MILNKNANKNKIILIFIDFDIKLYRGLLLIHLRIKQLY